MSLIAELAQLADFAPDELTLEGIDAKRTALQSRFNELLDVVDPDVIWSGINQIPRSTHFQVFQPMGVLNRVCWVIRCNARGTSSDLGDLAELVEVCLRSVPLELLWILVGTDRNLDPNSPATLAGAEELLTRLTSVQVGFSWVNEELLFAFLEVVQSDAKWAESIPSLTAREIRGIFEWLCRRNPQQFPEKLAPGSAGYELAKALVRESSMGSNLSALMENSALARIPFVETKDGIECTSGFFPAARSYMAVLELAESTWQRTPKAERRGVPARGKGQLFEAAIQRQLVNSWGVSDVPIGEYRIVIDREGVKSRDDIDLLWMDPKTGLTLIGECKSYGSISASRNSLGKISDERDYICEQLDLRGEALRRDRELFIDGTRHSVTSVGEILEIGVSIDPQVGPRVKSGSAGDVAHLFHVDGFLMSLRLCCSAEKLRDYLTFREEYLNKFNIRDEFDILIAFAKNDSNLGAEHRFADPWDTWFPSAVYCSVQSWESYLREIPKPVRRFSVPNS